MLQQMFQTLEQPAACIFPGNTVMNGNVQMNEKMFPKFVYSLSGYLLRFIKSLVKLSSFDINPVGLFHFHLVC